LYSDPIESRHRRFRRSDPGRGKWRGDSWAQAVSPVRISPGQIKPLISTHDSNKQFSEDNWFKIMVSHFALSAMAVAENFFLHTVVYNVQCLLIVLQSLKVINKFGLFMHLSCVYKCNLQAVGYSM